MYFRKQMFPSVDLDPVCRSISTGLHTCPSSCYAHHGYQNLVLCLRMLNNMLLPTVALGGLI